MLKRIKLGPKKDNYQIIRGAICAYGVSQTPKYSGWGLEVYENEKIWMAVVWDNMEIVIKNKV